MLSRHVHPWTPPYEKTFAVVVRARDEDTAREAALTVAGNEGRGVFRILGHPEDQFVDQVWLDRNYTECLVLDRTGEPGVIVYDRREG